MANTGYGACEDIDETTRKAIENRQKANASPAGYLPWQTKRKPWIKAYSCAVDGSGAAVSNGLGDDGITKLSELYHSSNNRPLPGITGFSTTEEGTHGGFKEGKLKFVCWTKDDFATLSKSFLTYGMTVTVEWGWSINQENSSVAKNGFPGKRCTANDAKLVKAIAAHQKNTAGCYECIRGQVTDFSWAMAVNGSFEGECTLTSMAGNTAKNPIKVATKDCTCAEDKNEKKAEKGPTWNIMQIADQYIDQCTDDEQVVKEGGTVTGVGLTSNVDSDAEGAESSWIFWSKASFNYVTFEAFEEFFVNLQCQSVSEDSGNEGTTRDQAATLIGKGSGTFVSSKKPFTSLFYSNHSVLRAGVNEIASGDPRVCLLPGSGLQQKTIDNFKKHGAYKAAKSCFASDGIYLANILLNLSMIKEEFDNCTANTGAGEFMKRILSRVNESCGGIWNFSMVPYSKAENIVQWLDIDKGPQTVTTLTIPAYGKDSVARGVSTQTETDPDFQAQIMYGANNKNGKGGGSKSGGVALWAGDVIDSYMDKIRVSSECTPADSKKKKCTVTNDDSGEGKTVKDEDVEDIFENLGNEVNADTVASATRCVHTLAKGETIAAIEEDVRVIPVPITLDLELDGIGGFTFGNLITINSLPNAYKGWYFQITKVEHTISNADWTTNLSCGMMRKI